MLYVLGRSYYALPVCILLKVLYHNFANTIIMNHLTHLTHFMIINAQIVDYRAEVNYVNTSLHCSSDFLVLFYIKIMIMNYSQDYSYIYCHKDLIVIVIHGCSIRVLWCVSMLSHQSDQLFLSLRQSWISTNILVLPCNYCTW